MKVEAHYAGGFAFDVQAGKHQLRFDTKAPVGQDTGPSPKEIMLATILGCSGMDIAGLLKKYRIAPTKFSMTADANAVDTHPKIFPRIDVTFDFAGTELDVAKIVEAAKLSMTKYCGVSAMINPTSPIHYKVIVNGETVSEDQAKF
jgi:putative redox protein